MPSRLRCPSCRESCPVPDDGRATVRCEYCGLTFPIRPSPASDPPPLPSAGRRPARPARADDEDDAYPTRLGRRARPPARSRGMVPVLAGLAGVLVLCLGAVLAGVGYVLWSKPAADRRPANAGPPAIGPAAPGPAAAAPAPPFPDLPGFDPPGPIPVRPDGLPGDVGRGTLPPAGPPSRADERVRNGDFEQGAKGFRTGYTHTPGELREASTLCVVTNPRDAHSDAAAFGDHTTGRGKMLAVNGSDLPDQVLWGQDVTIKPGAVYTFTVWVASWYSTSPAELEVRVDGQVIGRVVAPTTTGEWKEFRVTWAGEKPKAVVEIFNKTREVSGNDFAIDDISLRGPAP
jgi:hypothetical protein